MTYIYLENVANEPVSVKKIDTSILLTVIIQQLLDDAQYNTKNYAVRGGLYWSILKVNCKIAAIFAQFKNARAIT